MDHLKNLLAGAAGLVTSLRPRPYAADGGFAQDAANMRSDWRQVGNGLRRSLKSESAERKHVKQANTR